MSGKGMSLLYCKLDSLYVSRRSLTADSATPVCHIYTINLYTTTLTSLYHITYTTFLYNLTTWPLYHMTSDLCTTLTIRFMSFSSFIFFFFFFSISSISRCWNLRNPLWGRGIFTALLFLCEQASMRIGGVAQLGMSLCYVWGLTSDTSSHICCTSTPTVQTWGKTPAQLQMPHPALHNTVGGHGWVSKHTATGFLP